jgi:hypothetical protein
VEVLGAESPCCFGIIACCKPSPFCSIRLTTPSC